MPSLPIDAIETQFIQNIKQHHLVVEAETGSGKSTKLPLWSRACGRVLVVEPRRIACTSLAEFIAGNEACRLGDKIGYAIKLDTCFNENSEVVFVTPGVALRWLAENQLEDFDVVLIDEFHERRWDTDLLLALLKQINRHRLVITSATIEGEKLAAYVGAERMVAEGRVYKVDIEHSAGDSHYLPDQRDIDRRVLDAVKANLNRSEGDILVFLPGRKEISQCMQALKAVPEVITVPLHSSVSDEQRYQALHQLDQRKVVLATNIAETSLTIPDISLVIDSGLERRTSQRNGRTVLSLKSISKASARQRAGRAGRVMDGRCIRLYGSHAAMESVTPPELLREELTEAMLACACCGYQLAQLLFLDSLPDKSLANARAYLEGMRAIDSKGKVTEHGRVIYPLPIDALYADLITRMETKKATEAMVDLAAGLSVPASLYKLPSSEEKTEHLNEQEKQHCDGELIIRLVRGETFDSLNVDSDALKEAKALARQMRELFELPQLEVASALDRPSLIKSIINSHSELVFVRREKRRQALGNGFSEVSPGRNSRFSDKSEAAIVLDQHSLPGRGVKQTLNLATVMLPVPLSCLSDASLGEWRQGETLLEDDKIYSRLDLIYAGRKIASKRVQPEGDLLFKPILDAVISEELLPGFASERSQQIAHWCLYNQLGLADTANDISELSFESWFTGQLKELGISTADELSMFCGEDFPFQGIPYWEYKEFAETYPYNINLGDLRMKVEYFAGRKLVQVIYTEGNRKGDPKRWELPKWQGWQVQYKKASRIKIIK